LKGEEKRAKGFPEKVFWKKKILAGWGGLSIPRAGLSKFVRLKRELEKEWAGKTSARKGGNGLRSREQGVLTTTLRGESDRLKKQGA